MLHLRPLLFQGSSRAEYIQFLSTSNTRLFSDLGLTLGCLSTIVAIRLAFNFLFSARAAALVEQRAKEEQHKDSRKLMEECWVALGNTVMLFWSSWVMMEQNGGCWFFDTDTCLAGWPLQPAPPAAARLYYNAEAGWYLHLLLKRVLRYGQADGRDMVAHHICTLALVVLSYGLGVTRGGILVLCLFNVSNPFLHVAKVFNQLGMPARMPAFGLFAAVFFVTRVLLVPYSILWLSLVDSGRQVPLVMEDFFVFYLIINALLCLLYALQLMWMWGIMRVLRRAITAGGESASRLSTHVDPSKRYKVMVEENGQGKKAD